MIKGLSLLRNIGTDYTHLYRMVQATYHTSPWWVKGLEFVLQWALTVEILVWFAVFGPVALGWYIPVVLLSLYLNAFTLLHTRYLPSWGEAIECSFSEAGWDRMWNI